MGDFRMPSLGADMAQGTLLEWRVRPGDAVRRGDVIAVVDTDKAAIEVEVWESGVVDELVVTEGTRVPVGAVLARLRPPGASAGGTEPPSIPGPSIPAAEPTGTPARAAERPAPAPAIVPSPVPPTRARTLPAAISVYRPDGRVRASPAARRLAASRGIDLAGVRGTGPDGAVGVADVERAEPVSAPHRPRVSPVAARVAAELGVDLSTVSGSGSHGAVTRADVERAAAGGQGAASSPPAAGPDAGAAVAPVEEGATSSAKDRSAAMRAAIAAAVEKSKREIPHYYLWTHVDFHRALEWLARENAKRGMDDRILPAALLLKATALALRDFGELNGFWIDGAFRPGDGIHLGVAVFLRGGGLVAPAILEADTRPLGDLMRDLAGVVGRARAGGLRGAEMTSATVTVTNLGDRGVEGVLGVIHPPQVAIVGFGRVVERPWAEGGMVGVRPVVAVTLAADHRASDGHRGSLFLERVAALLQKPEEL